MTNRQLKDLMAWKVKPLLVVSRLDVSVLVMAKTAAEIYDDLSVAVDAFSTAMGACMPDWETCKPEDGTVIFGSCAQGWAFTLPQVARIYAAKFGIEVDKMAKRLWGEHYFSAKQKKWSTVASEDGVRAFQQFVLDPILKIQTVSEAGDVGKLEKMLTALGVSLSGDDKKLTGRALFRRAMQLWLPAGQALGDAMIQHLPDPVAAQAKRFSVLSAGPKDDPSALAIKACDPSGQVLMLVSKLVPMPSSPGRFYCVGRVFSGTMGASSYQILADDYVPEHARSEKEEEKDAKDAQDG